MLTLVLMGLATFAVGLLPTFDGFRCKWGAETYAAFRSVVTTKANRTSVLGILRFVLATKLPVGPSLR